MRIAVLGGTGDIGRGLILRWARDTDHELFLGSRDLEKARATAEEYENVLELNDVNRTIEGVENKVAADRADVVVLAVPPYYVSDTVENISEWLDERTILVSPAVGMKSDTEGIRYHRPPAGSVTALVAKHAPEGVPVVGAYHNVPANRLADLDVDLNLDTLVVADDEDAKRTVQALTEEIDGLRALDVGSIANAAEVEGITPLMITVARRNEAMHDVGVKFTGNPSK